MTLAATNCKRVPRSDSDSGHYIKVQHRILVDCINGDESLTLPKPLQKVWFALQEPSFHSSKSRSDGRTGHSPPCLQGNISRAGALSWMTGQRLQPPAKCLPQELCMERKGCERENNLKGSQRKDECVLRNIRKLETTFLLRMLFRRCHIEMGIDAGIKHSYFINLSSVN